MKDAEMTAVAKLRRLERLRDRLHAPISGLSDLRNGLRLELQEARAAKEREARRLEPSQREPSPAFDEEIQRLQAEFAEADRDYEEAAAHWKATAQLVDACHSELRRRGIDFSKPGLFPPSAAAPPPTTMPPGETRVGGVLPEGLQPKPPSLEGTQ